MQEEITIKVYRNSDGEFNYDIYDTNEVDEDTEPVDGGTCTSGEIKDGLQMATSHCLDLILKDKYNIK